MLRAGFEVIAIVLDGICILTRTESESERRQENKHWTGSGGCIPGVDFGSKVIVASRRSSMSEARIGNGVGLGRFIHRMLWFILFPHFVCSRVTMSVRPIRHPRDAEETVLTLDERCFLHPLLKQTITSFRPFVISLVVNTGQPHS